jgi:hypothetical protein
MAGPPRFDHRCQASKKSAAKLPLPLLKLRPKPVIASLSFTSLTISREAGKHQKRPNSPNGGHSRPFHRHSLSASSREFPPMKKKSPNPITIATSHTQSSSDSLSRKSHNTSEVRPSDPGMRLQGRLCLTRKRIRPRALVLLGHVFLHGGIHPPVELMESVDVSLEA